MLKGHTFINVILHIDNKVIRRERFYITGHTTKKTFDHIIRCYHSDVVNDALSRVMTWENRPKDYTTYLTIHAYNDNGESVLDIEYPLFIEYHFYNISFAGSCYDRKRRKNFTLFRKHFTIGY